MERRLHRDRRGAGLLHASAGLALGLAAGAAVRSTALATTSAVAGRALGRAAHDVGRALDAGDLEQARALLPALVGRDPAGLDEGEVARAAVESVAENTVDAVVAPALWAARPARPGPSATAPSTRSTPWSGTARRGTPTTGGPVHASTTSWRGCRPA